MIRSLPVVPLLAVACWLGGCAATRPPAPTDPGYPQQWAPLAGLGEECRALDGTYVNGGVLIDPQGSQGSIRLTDLLFAMTDDGRRSPDVDAARDAVRVRLSVATQMADQSHNTIGRLDAVVETPGRTLARRVKSYCRGGILMFVASTAGGGDMLGAGGTQRNVWLSFGRDGALVAKLGDYAAGIAVVVPYGRQRISWARFDRD